MVDDGALPNTKTFTALIGSFGKMGSVAAALEVHQALLSANFAPQQQTKLGRCNTRIKACAWGLVLTGSLRVLPHAAPACMHWEQVVAVRGAVMRALRSSMAADVQLLGVLPGDR